jgi:hypothetical protein
MHSSFQALGAMENFLNAGYGDGSVQQIIRPLRIIQQLGSGGVAHL